MTTHNDFLNPMQYQMPDLNEYSTPVKIEQIKTDQEVRWSILQSKNTAKMQQQAKEMLEKTKPEVALQPSCSVSGYQPG
jgi:hypothetical protein